MKWQTGKHWKNIEEKCTIKYFVGFQSNILSTMGFTQVWLCFAGCDGRLVFWGHRVCQPTGGPTASGWVKCRLRQLNKMVMEGIGGLWASHWSRLIPTSLILCCQDTRPSGVTIRSASLIRPGLGFLEMWKLQVHARMCRLFTCCPRGRSILPDTIQNRIFHCISVHKTINKPKQSTKTCQNFNYPHGGKEMQGSAEPFR